MILAIASGKGGTGKTTIAINLALAITDCQLIDCDVEEPNAHIFLEPKIETTNDVTIDVPLIDDSKCTKCGICSDACEFNALISVPNQLLFYPELCLSCGACLELCPENAITMRKNVVGEISEGKAKNNIQFLNGTLKISIPRAIPIVEGLKDKINSEGLVILDAPPGNSCLVIETIRDSDYCLFVTEPTPFGLWDLRIAVGVAKLFKLKHGVVINRSGIGNDSLIEDFCKEENVPILLRIPFDRKIAEAYSKGIPMVEYDKHYLDEFKTLYERVLNEVKSDG